MAFVRVTDLRNLFGGIVAVNGVSFSIEAGHTLALPGPSGCGKTTILRCLAGLENADAGAIEIAGKTVFDRAARVDVKPEQRDLGVVFQSYAVWPHMTVAGNVGFPLRVRRRPPAEIAARTARILDLVGLAGAADKPATALSGGQQQRVALARAWCTNRVSFYSTSRCRTSTRDRAKRSSAASRRAADASLIRPTGRNEKMGRQ